MSTHKTVFDDGFNIEKTDDLFDYQTDLTNKLDNFNQAFDQQIINEIVLWKVNRYAPVTKETIELLNKIDANSTELEIKLTREVLKSLLETKGIQLPMASTILRFKNEKIYQIIDQRVYRIINKEKKLKIKTYPTEKNIDEQINIYLQYLTDLKIVCNSLKISFDKADRILFMADRRINKDIPLDNYSSKKDKQN